MDRFDDIWKNRFNEENLEDSDWNTPDDKVWEGIIPHVVPAKDSRPFWLIWIFLMIISVLLILILIANKKNQISSVSIDSYSSLVLDSKEFNSRTVDFKVISTPPKKGINQNNLVYTPREKLPINVSPSDPFILNTISTYLKSKTKTFFSNKYLTDETSMDINYTKPEKSISLVPLPTENFILNDKNENKFTEEYPELISSLDLFLFLEKSALILPDSKSRKVNRFFLGVEAGATLWNHKISKDYTSDLALFDFNYQNSWGWQTSVSLGYNLNQYIGVIANFQYDQIETTSGHNSNLKYSIQEEQGINNPLNGYALNLATPYGLSGATFNFNRSQTLATDEVNLVVDFSSRHSIKNFSLPIGTVIYPFGRSKSIIPTLSVGFGLNYLAQITNKIQSIETHHDHIKYDDSGSATFVSPVLEKWHFDYRLGLGLKYKLRKGLHLQIKYDWVKGVSPIFKQNIYETRISRHQVSLGLTKSITP